MTRLHIDIETYSELDIKKVGGYRYAEEAEIILVSYSFDDEPVECVDPLSGEVLPVRLVEALEDPQVIKIAFNAAFERAVFSNYFGRTLPPEQWQCTMVLSAIGGYPLSLDKSSKAIGVKDLKDARGKRLITYFCQPCKPTKVNGGRTRNYPHHAPEDWQEFKEYNIQDVVAEKAISKALSWIKVPESEQQLWYLDQHINDRGVRIDAEMAAGAIQIFERTKEQLIAEAIDLTGIENPNSVSQLKNWIEEEEGIELESLKAELLPGLIKSSDSDRTKRLLEIRQELSKSSVKKYNAMLNMIGKEGRARGTIQFYGANRTGRFAGRGVQVHNLPKISDEFSHKKLSILRDIVKQGDGDLIDMIYGPVPYHLSQLLRTTFIPREGHRFLVADYSAIEARITAWLAGEQWRLDVFNSHGKIYEASASKMFKVPMEQIDKRSPLRQKGKVTELACIGFGELVLTDSGLVPIQDVKLSHNLWDGVEWVTHGGVVFKGIRNVIRNGGLRATPDHMVWVHGSDHPVPFGSVDSAKTLRRTAIGDYPLPYEADPDARFDNIYSTGGDFPVYDILNAGPRNRFTCSGVLVHNCGFQGGVGALIRMGALDGGIPEEELPGLIRAWRKESPNIVDFWYGLQRSALAAIKTGLTTKYKQIAFKLKNGSLLLRLPSGRCLHYPKATIMQDDMGRDKIVFMGLNDKNQWTRIDTYGGKLTENCCAAGTKVLTSSGIKPIVDVLPEDKVWDGFHWVSHGGVKFMGERETISLNGIRLTHDHRVFVKSGYGWEHNVWKAASSCHRKLTCKVQLPDGSAHVTYLILDSFEGDCEPVYDILNSGKLHRFCVIDDNGAPVLIHNCVQATARDCLKVGMMNLDKAGYPIVMHVHDEVIAELPFGEGDLTEMVELMCKPEPWMEGLPLSADNFETEFYKKDDE